MHWAADHAYHIQKQAAAGPSNQQADPGHVVFVSHGVARAQALCVRPPCFDAAQSYHSMMQDA